MLTQFPNQKLTKAEKIKEYGSLKDWARAVIDAVLSYGGTYAPYYRDRRYRTQVNYSLYHAKINPKDYNYVLKPYGVDQEEFPATLQHYDLISQRINLLKGDEMRRPFRFTVNAVNSEAVSEINDKMRDQIVGFMSQRLQGQLEELMGQIGEIPEGQEPPKEVTDLQTYLSEVQRYYKYQYRDIREEAAQHSLNYLYKYLNLGEKFNTGFMDMLISGEQIYKVDIINGNPVLRNVNPLYTFYDLSPDTDKIGDASWFLEYRYLTAAEVYDEFREDLTDEDVAYIESIKGNLQSSMPYGGATFSGPNGWFYNQGFYYQGTNTYVRVATLEWKGLRLVGFVTRIDEATGMEIEDMVDEDYKAKKGEKVEWKWINEVWTATKLGDSVLVKAQPLPNNYRNMNDPGDCDLSYFGICFNNRNSEAYSLVEACKPIQYLYNIIMYRLELEIARSKGRKIIMDLTQIPRSEGFDLQKWMYYFDVLGIGFINPFEEGAGKVQGQASPYNQFAQIDLSMARIIDQYIMILAKLEEMIGDISGVNKQRMGNVSQNELVTNAQQNVMASNTITEHIFYKHNECKRIALTRILEKAKVAWLDGKTFQYFTDEMERVMYQIDGIQFNDAEYGVFVTDGVKENTVLQMVQQKAEMALQSQQISLLDVIRVFKANNISEAERWLETALDRNMEEKQMEHQQQMELQDQQLQFQQQQMQEQKDLKLYEIDQNNQTKIKVAEIGAMSWLEDQDINDNNVPDVLEVEKLKHEIGFDQTKLNLEKEKIDLQRDKMKQDVVESEKDRNHDAKMTSMKAKMAASKANKKKK